LTRSSLPGLLGQIAEIAGPTAALQIAQARGGTRIAIPPQAEPDHWLTECVGFEVADQICKGLAIVDADDRKKGVTGEVLPLGDASVLKTAKRRLRQALAEGYSARDAARIAGLHERTAWREKARLNGSDDDGQQSLF
jgi:hypothetical protein